MDDMLEFILGIVGICVGGWVLVKAIDAFKPKQNNNAEKK